MEPKSLNVSGLRINYFESHGVGPGVVFVHGNSFSALSFTRQLESPLGKKYRLVSIDLPGHGGSERALDPASTYTIPGYADVLKTVASELDLMEAVFVGWSLGGHVVMEASAALDRARGFMIFGAPPLCFPIPMTEAYLINPVFPYFFAPELSDDAASAVVASILSSDFENIPAFFREDIRRSDPVSRPTLGKSINGGEFTDEVKLAAGLSVPLAIVHGERDQLVNGAYAATLNISTLWRGQVQVIAGAGHAVQWEGSERFNSLLDEFTEDCNR